MVLDTTADVDQIDGVQDREGDTRPAANADEQQITNARLGNHDSLTQFVYSTGGTAGEALDSYAVPDGVAVLVEYKEGNTGTVYVGDSDTQESALTGVGQSLSYRVTDTSDIYIRTPNGGDSVVVTFEVTA